MKKQGILIPNDMDSGFEDHGTGCVCVLSLHVSIYVCLFVYAQCTVMCTVFVCYLEQPPYLSMFGLLESRPVWRSLCCVHKMNPTQTRAHRHMYTLSQDSGMMPSGLPVVQSRSFHFRSWSVAGGGSSHWGILMRFHDVCFKTGSLFVAKK